MIPALLRENRSFRTFFLGQSVSLLGDQVSLIALPLVAVLVLDASPAQMGYLRGRGAAPEPALLAPRRAPGSTGAGAGARR